MARRRLFASRKLIPASNGHLTAEHLGEKIIVVCVRDAQQVLPS
jgi:hypothetical protein